VHRCYLAKRAPVVPLGSVWGARWAAGPERRLPGASGCLPTWPGRSVGWRECTDGVSGEQRSDADRLAAAAEEVETGRGPVASPGDRYHPSSSRYGERAAWATVRACVLPPSLTGVCWRVRPARTRRGGRA